MSSNDTPRVRQIHPVENLPEYAGWTEVARIMRDSFPNDDKPHRFNRKQLDSWHRRRDHNGFPDLHEVEVNGMVWDALRQVHVQSARLLKVSEVLDWYSRYVPTGRGPNKSRDEAAA